jgi:two-component system sensor histidine kinase/response regulator
METILVVDDNATNRALAEQTLEDEGYVVLLAASGQEGLDLVAARDVDCVLLDVRMPGMDGIAVCESLRKSRRGANVPVVFLTALRDIDTFDRAIAAGGDDFLSKPVMPSELLVRVRMALRLRKLDSERGDLVSSLRKQRDDLLRLQLQKERLIAFLVHDLKSPVATIDLLAQLLARSPGLSDDARSSSTQIRTEARRLNRMILNLLDVGRADEGKLTPKLGDVSLARVVAEVFDEFGPSAREHDVTLRADISLDVARVDAELFRRVVANLVENALRHAPPNSEVVVETKGVAAAGTLSVRDVGPGVPEAARTRIFEAFTRGEASEAGEAAKQNRGLGLAFCKVVAEAHRGAIWLEDAGPGARFCIRWSDG